MPKELVLNELSLSPSPGPPGSSRTTATARMRQFFAVLSTVKALSRSTRVSLRASIPLNEWLLAPDYAIKQWRNDQSVDVELRRKLLAVDFNWPAIREQAEPDLMSRHLGSEYLHEGQPAVGLGLAWLLDGLAISFDQSPWVSPTVALTEKTIGDDEAIESELAAVPVATKKTATSRSKISLNRRSTLLSSSLVPYAGA